MQKLIFLLLFLTACFPEGYITTPSPSIENSGDRTLWSCSSRPGVVLEKIETDRYMLMRRSISGEWKNIREYYIPDNSLPASAYGILNCFND